MTKAQAQRLAEKYDGKIRNDYSGRSMYGKTTYAVEVDRGSFADFKRSRSARNYRTDNMGLDYVIY